MGLPLPGSSSRFGERKATRNSALGVRPRGLSLGPDTFQPRDPEKLTSPSELCFHHPPKQGDGLCLLAVRKRWPYFSRLLSGVTRL